MKYTAEEIRELIDASRGGDEQAAAKLGNIYMICGFWGADFDEVVHWLKMHIRINRHASQAKIALAQHYLHMGRTQKEKRKGLETCVTMAIKGDEDAMGNLVLAYLMGLGTRRNTAMAIRWYNRLNMEDEDFITDAIRKLLMHVKAKELDPETIMHVGYGIYTSNDVEEDGCIYPSVPE